MCVILVQDNPEQWRAKGSPTASIGKCEAGTWKVKSCVPKNVT